MTSLDPIDVQLHRSGATALSRPPGAGIFRWRSGPFPALLLMAGIGTGPHGLALLTPAILDFLDPAAPVALAALGVIAGLNLRTGRAVRRTLAAAHAQAILAGLLLATAVLFLSPAAIGADALPSWPLVSLVLAVAAATSCSLPPDGTEPAGESPVRLDVDDYLVPIVAGSVALALIRAGSPAASLLSLTQTVALAVAIAAGGWLLLSRDGETTEQRVFTVASVLLLGGAADYVSASALLAGLVAGCCWRWAGGAMREHVRRDVASIQHSLVVLILLLSGAHAEFSRAALLLSAVYIIVRTTGKLAGGWLAAWAVPDLTQAARLRLVSPGIFGVAFALNVLRAGGPEFAPVLTAVVIGTIASSLIAALALRDSIEW